MTYLIEIQAYLVPPRPALSTGSAPEVILRPYVHATGYRTPSVSTRHVLLS